MSSWKLPPVLFTGIGALLTNLLDRRRRDVFPRVRARVFLTRERRRTCTSWFRAGQTERATQNRVIALFRDELKYRYLGDWTDALETATSTRSYSPIG